MLECCISGGGAGLGNSYILTVVVVMIEDIIAIQVTI